MSTTYKVSYVITGKDHPGAILNIDHRPLVGDQVRLENREFTILEVIDLIPPRGDFQYLHVTLKKAET